MPVSCKKINGKYRIVGPNGTVEKTAKGNALDGGGHSTKAGCAAQARAINASLSSTENAKKNPRTKVVPSNPLKADPTRTQTLRRRFLAEVHKRFRRLKGKILELVIEQDVFGIKPKGPFDFKVFNADNPELAINDVEDQLGRFAAERWRFRTNPQKLEAFQLWLKQQIEEGILDVASADPEKWWIEFVERGYRQGAGRAFDDTRKPALSLDDQGRVSDFYQGTKDEFLRASFARPESVEKVKLLTGRVFTDLQGVTKAMETSMVRVLADGLVRGENPRTIARSLNKEVDGIGKRRAEMIARSEAIRAHSEGQLDSLEQLGVTEVGVAVEWSTAGDGRVCPRCAPLQGTIHPIKKAHGLIPRHPNCLPGDCLVTSRSWISAASKRWFDGDFVVIKTASGRELTCTPNHPVLTDLGWVAAESVNLGCQVVCDSAVEWKTVGYGDHNNIPTRIHDVAESVLNSREVMAVPVPLSPIDFHGDGRYSKVAVIGTYRSLLLCGNASALQGYLDPEFQRAGGLATVGELGFGGGDLNVEGHFSTPTGLGGRRDLPFSLSRIHSGPFDRLRLGLGSEGDSSVYEPPVYDASGDPELFSQSIGRGPVDVFLDQVVYVERYPVSCHVYNLQTDYGWYTANGIITHNCRCAFLPANVGEPEQDQLRTKSRIEKAIRRSLKADGGKQKSRWVGADLSITKPPDSILEKIKPPADVNAKSVLPLKTSGREESLDFWRNKLREGVPRDKLRITLQKQVGEEDWLITDGRHRIAVSKETGRKTVPVRYEVIDEEGRVVSSGNKTVRISGLDVGEN